jgi:hypothetical protein|tara:strand:- start:6255 stop:6380 length:126 start_codon:yes stop_codon:yes gene_type:complete
MEQCPRAIATYQFDVDSSSSYNHGNQRALVYAIGGKLAPLL